MGHGLVRWIMVGHCHGGMGYGGVGGVVSRQPHHPKVHS